jgi:hypothetical protein
VICCVFAFSSVKSFNRQTALVDFANYYSKSGFTPDLTIVTIVAALLSPLLWMNCMKIKTSKKFEQD